jgi:hypothetical protein
MKPKKKSSLKKLYNQIIEQHKHSDSPIKKYRDFQRLVEISRLLKTK